MLCSCAVIFTIIKLTLCRPPSHGCKSRSASTVYSFVNLLKLKERRLSPNSGAMVSPDLQPTLPLASLAPMQDLDTRIQPASLVRLKYSMFQIIKLPLGKRAHQRPSFMLRPTRVQVLQSSISDRRKTTKACQLMYSDGSHGSGTRSSHPENLQHGYPVA